MKVNRYGTTALPGRDQLIKPFEDYARRRTVRYGGVKKRGGRYFYRKTLPAETVGKRYVHKSQTGSEKLLFYSTAYDPAKAYAMTVFSPISDGQRVVIALQKMARSSPRCAPSGYPGLADRMHYGGVWR